ncbi:MAG: ABC transporter permease, partial [Burkholderiaceae bacterium]
MTKTHEHPPAALPPPPEGDEPNGGAPAAARPTTGTNRPQAPIWRLAGRQAWRDFVAGELKLLLWAVVLAVGALTAVGFFADRMRSGLVRDAAQLLGGDAVVLSDRPLPPAFAQAARERGLAVGQAADFPS